MFQFKLDNGLKLDLEKSEKVFTPTGTTETIIEGIIENNNGKRSILDLGCGCGVIGLSLFKNGLVKEPLYASDLSDAAIENVKLNAEKMGCSIDAKKSNLFSAWENKKFETIVCDVSSISDEVAKFSPWFSSVECQTGIGGDKLIKEVFKNVSNFAEKNCKFYFPVISLSDVTSIKFYAEKYFKNMKIVKKKNWPLPDTMLPKIDFLRKLKEEKKVDFKERFGIVICYTEVYEVTIGL
jgi:release factor glutamine methyltransferase